MQESIRLPLNFYAGVLINGLLGRFYPIQKPCFPLFDVLLQGLAVVLC